MLNEFEIGFNVYSLNNNNILSGLLETGPVLFEIFKQEKCATSSKIFRNSLGESTIKKKLRIHLEILFWAFDLSQEIHVSKRSVFLSDTGVTLIIKKVNLRKHRQKKCCSNIKSKPQRVIIL